MRRPFAFIVFLIVFTVFLQVFRGFSSERAIKVKLFDIESGLSQSGVNALLIDSYGFLWAGTQDGLNRYDGYVFKVFKNNPIDSTSLSNNNINSICEDSNGDLWIATFNGLSVFKRSEEKFINYYHDPLKPQTISSNRIFYVYKDKSNTIWIKTLESLDKYNPETDSFTRYPHFSDPFSFASDNNDFAIYEDSKARLWVGTKDGLLLFDRSLGMFKRFYNTTNQSSTTNNNIKDITEDSYGNLWIATAHGVNIFSPKSEKFTRFTSNPNNPNSIYNNLVNVVYQDNQGDFWLGTDEGLSRYSHTTKTFESFQKVVEGDILYSSTINCIVEDNSNILWIGTNSGLVKWDRKPKKFNLYSRNVDGENLFSGNIIASVFEEKPGGVIWIGTWGTGLHLFDRRTGKITKYSEKLGSEFRITNDYVHVIYKRNNGEILIGTRDGIQVFDRKNKRFANFFPSQYRDAAQVFNENRVYDLKEDKKGNLWIATRMGLFKFDGKEIIGYQHDPNDSTTITSGEAHCLEIDGDFVWLGTLNGLNRINAETNEIKKFTRKMYKSNALISDDIISLKLDSKNRLWIGTASGLHLYVEENDFFRLFTENDGLPNNLIYSIEEDDSGMIWVSTNWGLASLDPNSNKIVSYGISDGLQGYEFNIGASYKSGSGEIFYGGINGVNSFFPDSISINEIVPPIVITSFEIVDKNGQHYIPVHGKDEITIDKDFSLINIEFSALDFTYPEKNLYQYKMDGLEDEWINLGLKRTTTFSNLKEGVYKFKVRAANSDNVWNNEGTTLVIRVETIFWKSKYAYILYTILFFVAIFLFLRTRTRIVRETSRLLKEREFTMAEMEGQKEELLLKNKSITDSINYAKRIQEALLPSEQNFKKILPDSFILYLPKDIVSGDFYWINETHNKIFVAVIDCTGHGVPGAFMSIIGVELLRNITNVMGVNDAAEILNRLDQGVRDTFSKNINDDAVNVKDGMDVSFCVIDKELNTLQYAGAFSNLYIIRDSKIIEIKGDRFTVGIGYEPEKSLFVNHDIVIEPDDMIYMFTDGYVDQFGGPEGKKYKFRRFRHLLLNIHKYPLDIQRKYLIGSINEWRGNLEQVDDILIIGIKPDLSCMF